MLGSALVPMFSSLIAEQKNESILKGYSYIQRYTVLTITFFSLGIISLSDIFLGIIGDVYRFHYPILVFFSFVSIVTSLFLGNTAILTSYEKNFFRLSVSTLQISIQIVGTYLFINSFGIYAVAGFKMGGVVLAQLIIIPYVTIGMKMGFKIPKIYWTALIVGFLTLLGKLLVVEQNLFQSCILFFISSLLFMFFGTVCLKDFVFLRDLFLRKKLVKGIG